MDVQKRNKLRLLGMKNKGNIAFINTKNFKDSKYSVKDEESFFDVDWAGIILSSEEYVISPFCYYARKLIMNTDYKFSEICDEWSMGEIYNDWTMGRQIQYFKGEEWVTIQNEPDMVNQFLDIVSLYDVRSVGSFLSNFKDFARDFDSEIYEIDNKISEEVDKDKIIELMKDKIKILKEQVQFFQELSHSGPIG